MKKVLVLSMIVWSATLSAQEVRPVKDDVGYCWQRPQMQRLWDYLVAHEKEDVAVDNLVAGIAPHDDYLYAGRVYFPLYRKLRAKEAVIFGVTHGTVRKEIGDPHHILLLDDYAAWTGLDREVPVSPLRQWLKERLPKGDYAVNNRAHALEHSIEAQIPFLQYGNPEIRITPIMVTAMPWERMTELGERLAEALAAYIRTNNLQLGRDIVFLISADANHYGRDFNNVPFGEDEKAHHLGIEQDLRFARAAFSGPLSEDKIFALTRELWGASYRDYRNTYWCGKYDIPFGLLTVAKTVQKAAGKSVLGRLFRYDDTYSGGVIPLNKSGLGITAPFSLKHWVGFLAAGFTLD